MAGWNPAPRDFTVLRFRSAQEFCAARRKMKDAGCELYNSRLQPFMQLVHRAGVSPSGWVSCPGVAGAVAECDWTQMRPVADPPAPMAPFVVTAYDIECYSESGDFPAAIKGYNKVARELVKHVDELLRAGRSMPDVEGRIRDALTAALAGAEGPLTPCDLLAGQSPPTDATLRQYLVVDLHDMFRQGTWSALPASERISRVAAKMNSLTRAGFARCMDAAAAAAGEAVARGFIRSVEGRASSETAAVADAVDAAKAASPWAPADALRSIATAALLGAKRAFSKSRDASDAHDQIRAKAERAASFEARKTPPSWGTRAPPLPRLKGDPIIQIGLTTRVGRAADLERTIFVLGSCDPVPGVRVEALPDEASVVRAFAAEIRRIDPDFVTGYNVMGFDFLYIRDRAEELGVPWADLEMGRDVPEDRGYRNPLFLEKRMVSSAYGDNTLRYFDMPGRVVFDLMKVVQREHKLASYKLDAVSQHFTGDKKDDLSPADIFRMHAEGPAERATVARYCVQDCALCSDLVDKLNTLPNSLGMADVCLVPTSWIFLRGQGCKVLSLVAKRCRLDGFAMPELRQAEADGYDGAFVLNPRIGVYIDSPVAVLDFSSLYPSSMIATNLSHDTMLGLDEPAPPGLPVEAVTFMLRGHRGEREVTRRFVQAGPGGENEGILPRTLKTLLGSRAAVRRQMKTAPDDFARSVLDGMQQAYKVTANSLYGQLGSATSDICCVDIAASTTAVGRAMLIKLKEFVEQDQGGDVVYGDSVAAWTPVFVRRGDDVRLVEVRDVDSAFGGTAAWTPCGGAATWTPCGGPGRDGKESLELAGVSVWSDAGWTPARRLIRHALAPGKRMLRVSTRTGTVDVTDDHSLLRPDGSIVKPSELRIGDRLLHADLPALPVPPSVAAELRRGAETGRRTPIGPDDHLPAALTFALAESSGYSPGVSGGDATVAVFAPPDAGDHPDAVTHIGELPAAPGPAAVYDFTTESGHFSAGVGRIVVHNTDSCFMTFPRACRGVEGREALRATIAAAERCSAEFRRHIKEPQNAEYEKTFWPFILISKKRYVGNMYEADADAPPKQKSMGLVLKRRDNANIVKIVYGGVIDRLLAGADVAGAIEFVKAKMDDLVSGRVPVSDLVVTKNLGGEYADPDRIAHAVLAKRMAERDPGSAPAVGDRVPYVYVLPAPGEERGALQGDRIEHPDHLGGARASTTRTTSPTRCSSRWRSSSRSC